MVLEEMLRAAGYVCRSGRTFVEDVVTLLLVSRNYNDTHFYTHLSQ